MVAVDSAERSAASAAKPGSADFPFGQGYRALADAHQAPIMW